MERGTFYSVGVGPGDPELMTLKAVRTIEMCDVIISPESGGTENMALKIAGEHVAGKRVVHCPMPMTRDAKTLAEYRDMAAEMINKLLAEGLSVAFLTIGDPSVYSTAMYVHKRLAAMGCQTKMIPGVTSFCAAAAALDTTLCEGGQPLHIIPASYGGDFTKLGGVKVLMKSGKQLANVLAELGSAGEENVSMVSRASLEDERVFLSIDEIKGHTDYFSVLVVKPK